MGGEFVRSYRHIRRGNSLMLVQALPIGLKQHDLLAFANRTGDVG